MFEKIKKNKFVYGAITATVVVLLLEACALYFVSLILNSSAVYPKKKHPSFAIYNVYSPSKPLMESDIMIPIVAGRAVESIPYAEKQKNILGDDTGKNISFKYNRFGKLTALYWIWKNAPKRDYIGFTGYPMYLKNEFFPKKHKSVGNKIEDMGLQQFYLEKLMDKYDVVVSKRYKLSGTVINNYNTFFHGDDLKIVIEYIKKNYPEMSVAVDNVISKSNSTQEHVFLMRQDIFKKYVQWLFDVMFATEKQLSRDAGYMGKVPEHLASILLNIWLEYNHAKYRIGELKIVRY